MMEGLEDSWWRGMKRLHEGTAIVQDVKGIEVLWVHGLLEGYWGY